MRISTQQIFNNGLNQILTNQEASGRTQQQLSSGRRVLTPADDPIAATQILQLQQDLAQREQFERNMTAAENRLLLEESALVSITENLTRVQELTVQAGGGALTIVDRQAIASEINELLGGLADLFNTRNPSGEYIFGGFQGEIEPFQLNPSGRYDYFGDEGQRFLAIGASTNVATGDNGKDLFVDVPATKNTFTADVNPLNQGSLMISPGFVTDQAIYDEFYPDDLIVTFNSKDALTFFHFGQGQRHDLANRFQCDQVLFCLYCHVTFNTQRLRPANS